MKRLAMQVVMCLALIAGTAFPQVPRTISYQGVLTDNGGAPVGDGTYSLTFRLYDTPTGGRASWTETQTVTTQDGVFDAILGSGSALQLLFDRRYWLGVTVESGTEMTPRIPLASSPYSIRAVRADTANDARSVNGYAVSSLPAANTLLPLDAGGRFPSSAIPSVPAAIPDAAVTTQKLADGAVTGGKIAAGQVVKSLNTLRDDVTLAAGSNVSITPNGNTLTISATPGGGGGDITAVRTDPGSGLAGGAESGDVALSLADAGVTRAKLAPGAAVTGVNGVTDEVTLAAGSNVSITPNGNTLTISATPGGGGGDITSVNTPAGSGLTGGAASGDVTLAIEVPLTLVRDAPGSTILGRNTGTTGTGVRGESTHWHGVHGNSENSIGVSGFSLKGDAIVGQTADAGHAGVSAENTANTHLAYLAGPAGGVYGTSSTGFGVRGESGTGDAVVGISTSADGVYGQSTDGIGVDGRSASDWGVYGQSDTYDAIAGITYSGTQTAIAGSNRGSGTEGRLGTPTDGVLGVSPGAPATTLNVPTGVHGRAGSGDIGVAGVSTDHIGVYGHQISTGNYGNIGTTLSGIAGFGINGDGVRGDSKTSDGVVGLSETTNKSGVYGRNTHASGFGVYGANYAHSTSGYLGGPYGARGISGTNEGFLGFSDGGVFGRNNTSGYYGYLGMATRAGLFSGNVEINGTLSKSSGTFKIDHPLDPANKFLYHSFVESPEMKNIYDGVAVLDANGEATVQLPTYFEALNVEFRYQLTCIGGYAPVYISREVDGNSFDIAGGRPGLKVSWQVTGVRHDAYAKAHPVITEVDKASDERGRYLHPTELGVAAELGIGLMELRSILTPADAAPADGAVNGRGR